MVEPIQGEKGVVIPQKGRFHFIKVIWKEHINSVKSTMLFSYAMRYKLDWEEQENFYVQIMKKLSLTFLSLENLFLEVFCQFLLFFVTITSWIILNLDNTAQLMEGILLHVKLQSSRFKSLWKKKWWKIVRKWVIIWSSTWKRFFPAIIWKKSGEKDYLLELNFLKVTSQIVSPKQCWKMVSSPSQPNETLSDSHLLWLSRKLKLMMQLK